QRGGPRWAATAAWVGAGSLVASGSLLVAAATHRVPGAPPPPKNLPLQEARSDDVTSRACRSCHPDQYASWHASYHRTMTQSASARSVLGDFRDAQVESGDTQFRLFARGDRFFAEVKPRDGSAPAQTVQLEQTTG